MKKTTKRTLVLAICAVLASASLVSCTQSEEKAASSNTLTDKSAIEQQTTSTKTTNKNETSTQTSSGSTSTNSSNSNSSSASNSNQSNDINQDKYEEQIKYYMELTETLQAELLKIKEETYIDECEYQLKIDTLEQTIQNLKDTISTLQRVEDSLPTVNDTPDKIVAKSEFKYTTEDGQITITGYNGTDIDITIPSNIDGFPVTKIGEAAFKNALIRSVVIPSSVRKIDWFAFSGCTCLESITIPSSVLSIAYGAFDYCPKSMLVNCEKGSYAEAYALSWGMKVVAQ